MNNLFKQIRRIILTCIISIISVFQFSVVSYAVEAGVIEDDIVNVETVEIDDVSKIQPYVNEPLDNAVPVIYKYEIEKDGQEADTIVPGEEFILKFTVYNPQVVSKLGNIRIVVTQPNELVYPKYKTTNSTYVGYVEPLSYAEGKVSLIAAKEISTETIDLSLYVSYTDNYSTTNTQQYVATLPVSTSGTLNISSVDIPSYIYAGANSRFGITYQNNGLSSVNDVILHVGGNKIESQEISLGTIGKGSNVSSDIYLKFTETGEQSIYLYFTYADKDGQIHETEKSEYTIAVNTYSEETTVSTDSNAERNKLNKFLTVIIAVISLVVVSGFLMNIFVKNKNDKALVKGQKR